MRRTGPAALSRQLFALLLLGALVVGALRVIGAAGLAPADMSFNNGTEVQTLDPGTITGVPEGRIARAIFEGLVTKDPRTLEPIPGAAESWCVSEDGRTYRFRLRAGSRWTNGDPVDAHDFVFSWRRMLHPRTAAEYAYQLWYVRGARQYSLLDDELLYASDAEQPAWVRVADEGARLVLGIPGFALEELAEDELRPLVGEGAELAAGQAFAAIGARRIASPLAGSVLALAPRLPERAGELARDPYRAGRVLELRPAPGALEGARAAGRLIEGERYRREVVEPELLGIRAPEDLLLEVELESPTPYFIDLCGFYALYPVNRRNLEEAKARWPGSWELEWLRPENIVTNGPFRVLFRRINDRIRLVKNHSYWDADAVAFESIDVLAVDRLGTSLNLYLTGAVDWIDRPITNVVPRLLAREDFRPSPYFGSYFYRVNVTRPPFDDRRLRRALALSIDRKAICEKVTKAGERPFWGFVPPVLPDHPKVRMQGSAAAEAYPEGDYVRAFEQDLARARELVAEAGFGPGGRALPTIEIHYNTDETHKDVAEVIADTWKRHLGLNVKLLNQEWKVYLDTQKTLGFDVSRSAWIGDYPDPNTFLDMFVTGGENNRTGWGDPRYDELVRRAAREPDERRRTELLVEAEEILLRELPILPIYSYVTKNLANPRLGGFHDNFLDEHFPKNWYWMDDEELEAKRAAGPEDRQRVEARGPREGLYPQARRRPGDE